MYERGICDWLQYYQGENLVSKESAALILAKSVRPVQEDKEQQAPAISIS